ncbi:hypothetical protein DPMN_041475 [Dreissena polymorpha]|uniref:Uncharacterized protein n=1 Tax=Dreissena polymorpha TaxID=45954 RepID=A0A9D4CXU8_DREPO|nr:hypothetical protein DPMN_041475 [Dreissena polymorpha]
MENYMNEGKDARLPFLKKWSTFVQTSCSASSVDYMPRWGDTLNESAVDMNNMDRSDDGEVEMVATEDDTAS